MPPNTPHIGLIVTGDACLKDFRIFCSTLEIWHPDAVLYVATDSLTPVQEVVFKGTIHIRKILDAYSGLNRQKMEKIPGKIYKDLWTDFMYEKANVLEWIFEENENLQQGAWFMDADIAHFAELPLLRDDKDLALSPHYIKKEDEAKFGKYNGGFLWMRDSTWLNLWRMAGETSRFYEQAALEVIARAAKLDLALHEFPIQVNYGWWRLFQSDESPDKIVRKFSRFDAKGILFEDLPLQSVHTHWYENVDRITAQFNIFILHRLKELPDKTLFNKIQQEHRWL